MKTNLRYSTEDLKEFEEIILEKLQKSKDDLHNLKASIARLEGEGGKTAGNIDDGSEAQEKEHLNQLAARLQKHIADLDKALFRIKNGTYGICLDTGTLISKERLRVVPHTQQTVEAKKRKL